MLKQNMNPKKIIFKKITKLNRKSLKHLKLIKRKRRLALLKCAKNKPENRLQTLDFDNIMIQMDKLINKRKPFKIRNVPSLFKQKRDFGIENIIESLLNDLEIKTIDASISENKRFSGHYSHHQRVPITLDEFLNYKGMHVIYIAQMPLYEKQGNNENDKKRLQILFKYFPILERTTNSFIDNIEKINLWYSKKPTSSQLHYDSYDNFLFMLKGTKVFTIYPPDNQTIVCESILTNSFQQAKKKQDSTNGILIKLAAGEGVFLSQGWYHEVDSFGEDGIIAINIWFNSIEQNCKGRTKYFLRYLLATEIERQIKDQLDKMIQQVRMHHPETFDQQVLSTSINQMRTLLMMVLEQDQKLFMQKLINMDKWAVEHLTRSLEDIDNQVRTEEQQTDRDQFYEYLYNNCDFQKIQGKFIQEKKLLRQEILTSLLWKLSNSYEFQFLYFQVTSILSFLWQSQKYNKKKDLI